MTYNVTLEIIIVSTSLALLSYLYCYLSGKWFDKKYKKGNK